jgi:hypothetical protein
MGAVKIGGGLPCLGPCIVLSSDVRRRFAGSAPEQLDSGLMKRVLTVGITYPGKAIDGVEIENLGLCQPAVDQARAAFPLYEYDTIIINPQSYGHFLFGAAG